MSSARSTCNRARVGAGFPADDRSGGGRPTPAPAGCGTCSPRWIWPPGQLFYRFRDRKRWQEFLGFLRQLRTRFSTGRLLVVCDNFSPHHKQQVRDWCAEHDVELVFTPSNASWLNWIECEFTALRYFTLDGSDYPSHAAQEAAITGYIRWANRRARPKQGFAVGSKIRRPDYLPNVA